VPRAELCLNAPSPCPQLENWAAGALGMMANTFGAGAAGHYCAGVFLYGGRLSVRATPAVSGGICVWQLKARRRKKKLNLLCGTRLFGSPHLEI